MISGDLIMVHISIFVCAREKTKLQRDDHILALFCESRARHQIAS